MSDPNMSTIFIPKPLAEKLKKRMQGTEFTSVSSYVIYILEEVLVGVETKMKKEEKDNWEDEEKAKDRLRAMGYLD